MAFRRQAALTGNRRWSQINPTLYSICFTGRAQQLSRCELCLSSAHGKSCAHYKLILTQNCHQGLRPWRQLCSHWQVVTAVCPDPYTLTRNPSTGEYCQLHNASKRRYTSCQFRHVCSGCRESHSALSCTKEAPNTVPKNDLAPESGALTRVANRKDAACPY